MGTISKRKKNQTKGPSQKCKFQGPSQKCQVQGPSQKCTVQGPSQKVKRDSRDNLKGGKISRVCTMGGNAQVCKDQVIHTINTA